MNNLEYNTMRFASWMARNEILRYLAEREKEKEKCQEKELDAGETQRSPQDMREQIGRFISDEQRAEQLKDIFEYGCRDDRERALLAFRFGLEDGKPKTLQETADRFGIRRERVRQIENMVLRKITAGHMEHRRRKRLADFLDDES